LATPGSDVWKLLTLVILASTSSIAILLLVPTPRYFLPCIPVFYLGIAFCLDSLLEGLNVIKYENPIIIGACLCLCSPNYLAPRPNYEIEAVRHVEPYVREKPRIAAWYATPEAVFGLRGNAEPVNISDGIRAADIKNGSIDILVIDPNFRSTKTWLEQKEFFQSFERSPTTFGFEKLSNFPSGEFDIYYRPIRSQSSSVEKKGPGQ
jgi:hypothetical protein